MVFVLSIIVIFLFKKRILQFKLTNIIILFNVMILGLFFLLDFVVLEAGRTISYEVGSFLPVISIVFAYMASHFIKKDEQLVRSADRIR